MTAATLRDVIVDAPLYGAVWTGALFAAIFAIWAVTEVLDWHRRKQRFAAACPPRRHLTIVDQQGRRRRA